MSRRASLYIDESSRKIIRFNILSLRCCGVTEAEYSWRMRMSARKRSRIDLLSCSHSHTCWNSVFLIDNHNNSIIIQYSITEVLETDLPWGSLELNLWNVSPCLVLEVKMSRLGLEIKVSTTSPKYSDRRQASHISLVSNVNQEVKSQWQTLSPSMWKDTISLNLNTDPYSQYFKTMRNWLWLWM